MRYTIKQARAVSKIKKYASVARIVRYQRAFNKYAYAYKLAEESKDPGIWENMKDFAKTDFNNAAKHPAMASGLGAAAGSVPGYIVDLLNALRKAKRGEKYSLMPGVGTLVGAGLGAGAGATPYIVSDIRSGKKKKKDEETTEA